MKLIDLYKEWMKTGKIINRPNACGLGGLCNAVPEEYIETLDIFQPELEKYIAFWGHEKYRFGGHVTGKIKYDFTPRRQTIVLFICAIHGEL